MAANYYCLLLDVDGTLLDFAAAEREAIAETLSQAGLPAGMAEIACFSQINKNLWAAVERREIQKEKLGTMRFEQLLATIEATGKPEILNRQFLELLAGKATPIPGAKEILEELAEFATLAVASNGIQRVLLRRLEESSLLPYFDDVFTSEKLGVAKPSAKFFDLVLKKLGIHNREKVLVIGDSLTADIQGGNNAHLDTCWCNFEETENTAGVKPTYTVRNYMELKTVAVVEEELKLAESREKRHLV